ncbi:MAG: NAD(P)/FAD-dependent oxidoreductase [Cyanobacteria bacterium TGS_CYA1]|nr:NAD(P)/FAD-dependent oxidoreductase [Cyanobacteria bacterium TGS_CYA1]
MNGPNNSSKKPRVVIIGAGFGGLSAAKDLRDAPVQITVVDRTNHHLFQPLLYQVAMAGLAPGEIACPIRSILRDQTNTEVVLAEVQSCNLDEKVLQTSIGSINFDYLVIAAGAQTNFYGHADWAQYAVGLKDIDDALEIRRRTLLAFEEAEHASNPERQKQLLTFVVIGAGPTGVELAGSLAEIARFALAKDFRRINPKSARVILLEGLPKVLPPFVDELSAKARDELISMGVEVRVGVKVQGIDGEGVHLEGGEFIASETVLWCAGVAPVPLVNKISPKPNQDRAGRLMVQADLSLEDHKNIFAIGDIANFTGPDGKPLPGLAPVAMQQGKAVADYIRNDLSNNPRRKFVYTDRGTLATIGRSAAVADFGKMKLTGFVAWLAWLFIHIMLLIGFRNRLVVLTNWMWSFLTYERGSRLITGHRMLAGAPECPDDTTGKN